MNRLPALSRSVLDGHTAAVPPARAYRVLAIGAQSVGAAALGVFALGALACGALAIGRLAVGRARIKHLEIEHLVVRRLEVLEHGRTDRPDDVDRSDAAVERAP